MLQEPFIFRLLEIEKPVNLSVSLCSYDQIYGSHTSPKSGWVVKYLKKKTRIKTLKGMHGSDLIADTQPHSKIHRYVKNAF